MTNRFPWNDATFQHLLQRYRNTYHLPETSEDVDRHFQQIIEHVDGLIRQARTDQRKWLAALDEVLEERITNLMRRLPYDISEASGKPDTPYRYQVIQENATKYLLTSVQSPMGERERQARLDEHKVLAALDEEGRKQRYLELAQEDKKREK